ncbi:MAG: RNA methyltransferase [bacterium]|nr:RNA methyltransferase [bacterium]MDT8365196.1 RNA methyltransferase [bacterium]
MAQTEGFLSREKLRDIRSLDSVKIRRRKGLCMVEGERSLREAHRTGNLLYLVVSEDRTVDGRLPLPEEFSSAVVPCYTLASAHFRELTEVKAGTGILGVARIPPQGDLDELEGFTGRSTLFFLDGLQEPGNVGALIRTAWALGFSGVLMGDGTADPFSAKGVRASAGGVFHLPLFGGVGGGIGAREMEGLTRVGYSLFAADREGQDYRSIAYAERSILALGNEGSGFSEWVLHTGQVVGIPLAQGVDSLNVVVAGGIIAAQMAAMAGRGEGETR